MIRRLLLGSTLALLAACGSGNQGPVAGAEPAALQADKVVVGMRHHITVNGIRQALLKADTAYFYDESQPIDFRQVHLTIYQATGEVAAIMTSETAQFDPRTEVMDARGNVVVVTPEDEQRIETEELRYDPGLDRLWSERPTNFIRDGKTTRGDGFTSDGRGQNVKVIRPSGHVEAPKAGF
jgi:LPS export ABC transporter protein LptC